MESRLTLEDNMLTAMMKMADGNMGAIACMTEIMKENERIDPQAIMGGMGTILSFDDMGIYGTSIYVLWSDKCGKDTRKLLMLLRARQLGFFPEDRIKEMAADQMKEVNISDEEMNALDDKVCGQLEQFMKKSASL